MEQRGSQGGRCVVQDIACNTNVVFGDGVSKDEIYFEQASCQSFISLENAMLLEVEILFFFVHLGINYFGFLCVNVGSMKILMFPHI